MDNFSIGVLGGMGTYATINLFHQYAEIFDAEKEWERPRIVIDNRCTMPSRVRAFLYNEKVDELVNEMSDSMQKLTTMGCTKIMLACNTSHLFLPKIYEKFPELEQYVVNIIEECAKKVSENCDDVVYLLGSEGTIESKVYQNVLEKMSIECITPKPEEYHLLRDCIEAVKQNKYSDEVKKIFIGLVNQHDTCILGCTELPVLYGLYKSEVSCRQVYDPIGITLEKLKKEYDYE